MLTKKLTKKKKSSLLHPGVIVSEIANLFFVMMLPVLAYLPKKFKLHLSEFCARLVMRSSWKRNNVVSINLKKCFPELTEIELLELRQQFFVNMFYAMFHENSVSWHRSNKYIMKSVTLSGSDIITNHNNNGLPVLIICPHFTHMFLAARIIRFITSFTAIRKKQHSRIFESYYGRRLDKYDMRNVMQRDVRKAISLLKKKNNFLLLPDADLGTRNSIFANFFGIPTATVTSVSQFAKLGRAKVVMALFRRHQDGTYLMEFKDISEKLTLQDYQQDATFINEYLADFIRKEPSQYGWLHRRFKTRPPGEPDFYK
ncbi:MAG: hypothetical protein VX335_00435 [Pseudomonadota bacterium]|nr:hypothetical protein [Pseudomonadota bacterium]